MPSTVKCRIHGARKLQNLTKITPDSYVSITLGGHSAFVSDYEASLFEDANAPTAPKRKCYQDQTRVIRKSLNPEWEQEFRFDVADDSLLQDEPLIFKILDSDALSSGDGSIGSVYVDLNPLLMRSVLHEHSAEEKKDQHVIDGWCVFEMPCYDSPLHHVLHSTSLCF